MSSKTPRAPKIKNAIDGATSATPAEPPHVPSPPVETPASEPPINSDEPVISSLMPLPADHQSLPNSGRGQPQQFIGPTTVDGPLFTPEAWRIIRRVARALLVIGALYGIGWLLLMTGSALMPFVIGLVLAYLLLPVVNRLNTRMPRWAAILLVYVVGLIVVVAAIAFIVPPVVDQVRQLLSSIPPTEEIIRQSNLLLTRIRERIPEQMRASLDQVVSNALTTIRTNLTDYVQNIGTFLLTSLLQVVNTLTFLFGFLVVPFWLFYVLNDQKEGLKAVDNLLPRAIRNDFWAIMRIIDNIFSKYIGGQLFLGLVVGTLAGIGLFVLRLFGLEVPYILLLAIFAGITELVPVVGPVIGAVPAVILAFFDGDSPTTTVLAVILLYVGIQQVENQFLVPRIVGESVGLHPAILMVLLIVCSSVFGLLGAILAAPVSAAFRDIFTYLYYRLSEPSLE